MFKNQPKGLFALALANTGERFGYYTMLAVFALFLRANFGLSADAASRIYAGFLAFVYFLPLIGGWIADKIGYGKCVTIGIFVMFLGYVCLALPLGGNGFAMGVMLFALLLISFGTGLFKGNLQVMVGNLYDDPQYADRRDAAFSLFYMAINIGAMFAPTAAVKIMAWAQESLGYSVNDSYHFAFMVACASLILSIAIYYACRPWFKHVEYSVKQVATQKNEAVEELREEEGLNSGDAALNSSEGAFNSAGGTFNGAQRLWCQDAQLETDIPVCFPTEYIENISERITLYRELDSLHSEEQLLDFRKKLIDRFGVLPEPAEELLEVVRLRWLCCRLGVEKILLKGERMTMYLVQHKEAYWQSEMFGNIVQYAVTRPERCILQEEKDKKGLPTGRRMVTITNVKTIGGAITLLSKIERNEL